MADVNLYFYIENLALTSAQRDTLVDQLKAFGQRNADGNPRYRNHWRIRLDTQAVIFEAVWDDTQLTATAMRNRLAAIFGVANTSITYSTTQTVYGPVVTYAYSASATLRMGVFGGLTATYLDSQVAALQFLKDNSAAWEA
jgi:hypothetical protein